jgi:hypothetical protein
LSLDLSGSWGQNVNQLLCYTSEDQAYLGDEEILCRSCNTLGKNRHKKRKNAFREIKKP